MIAISALLLIIIIASAAQYGQRQYNKGYNDGLESKRKELHDKIINLFNRLNNDNDYGFIVHDGDAHDKNTAPGAATRLDPTSRSTRGDDVHG